MRYYVSAPPVSSDTSDLSRAQAKEIADLIDRFLDLYQGVNGSIVSRETGISESYIARWRKGQMPKHRLQTDTRSRLERVTKYGRPTDAPHPHPTSAIPNGIDPVSWAAAKLDLISQIAGDASAQLVQYRRGRRFTPEELGAIGGAVVERQLAEEESEEPRKRVSGE